MLLLNASGCLDALTAPEVARALDAFVTKTVTPAAARGNAPPRIAETEFGMLNAIGLANPGRERSRRDAAAPARRSASRSGSRSAASRPGLRGDVRALARTSRDRAQPVVPERRRGAGVGGRDRRRLSRGDRDPALRQAFAACLGHRRDVVRAVEAAGADGISLVNTLRGLALDARLAPVLARGSGGYSGPALKPVALAAVHAARRATTCRSSGWAVSATGRDALELSRAVRRRRARHGPVRRSRRAAARARGARRRVGDAGLATIDDAFCAPTTPLPVRQLRSTAGVARAAGW